MKAYNRTLIGLGTYGNLPFTKLAVQSVRATVTDPHLLVIVGQPDDAATLDWLRAEGIAHQRHAANLGYPAAFNDLHDAAWTGGWHQLIVIGNDVVVYPDAINSLMAYAAAQPVDWIAGWEISPEMLIREHPDTRRWFRGDAHVFTDFDQRPWDAHQPRPDWTVNSRRESLCFNSLLLFKRRVFEQLGYMDANFFPVYFSDNDYWFRLRQTDLRACALSAGRHFHFGSRTLHQGVGGSSSRNFEANRAYYLAKWGGNPGQEQWTTPFNGNPQWAHERYARALRITTRVEEAGLAESWRQNTRPE